MKYTLDYGDGQLTCWSCGEDKTEALIIEWQRNFEKQIVCMGCYATLLRNGKDIKVDAHIGRSPFDL